jgi:hypothetical protein
MWGWKEEFSVKSRAYFSIQHIQSAALFARHAGQIEKEYDGNFSNELITEYRANVTASIFAAIAFLEATINESFADASQQYGENRLNSNTKALMAEKWKSISKNYKVRMMDKFDIALTLAKKPKFDREKPPAQDIALIVQLRNSMVHYYPEWVNDETTASSMSATEKKFIKGLRGKFPTSPLMSKNNPFFPDKCLSYGCARWAVLTSLAYSDCFYAKLGLSAPYEHIRQHLRTI